MKIGFCGRADSYEVIKEAGYDFIEMPVMEVMANLSDEEYESHRLKLEQIDIPCLAFNSFVLGTFSIIDDYMKGTKDVLEYCQVAIERIADLGGKIIVFGSGKARMIPEGVDFETATDVLIDFVRDCADFAKPHGITIAIEHLNKGECNILTSVKETGEFVRRADRDNVKVLYDTYHMALEDEDINNLVSVMYDVAHIHIRDKEGALYPHKDIELYETLNGILKQAGYKGAISVECRVNDLETETKLAMDVIENMFDVKRDE